MATKPKTSQPKPASPLRLTAQEEKSIKRWGPTVMDTQD